MSEAKSDPTGSPSDHEAERRQSSPEAGDDYQLTTRMPAMSPSSAAHVTSSSIPPPPGPEPLPSFELSSSVLLADSDSPGLHKDASAHRPSWWRGLLTATFPPRRAVAVADDATARRAVAATAATLSLVLLVSALVIGLRAAPFAEPAVAAAVVESHAALALGLMALAGLMLRSAERLFFHEAIPAQAVPSPDPGRGVAAPIN